MLSTFFREIRHAFRSLRRSPALTAAAVITLALGIGANTAIFSVLEGVVLAPLPYAQPDRLVLLLLYNHALKHATWLSYPDFLDWQRESRSFEQIAAFSEQGFDVSSPGTPEHVHGLEVSAGFFSTLGIRPALGRSIEPAEDRIAGAPVVMISDRLWQDRFARSPATLGKTVTLDGVDYTIVGVLPPGFRFLDEPADVYTPIGRSDPLFRTDRTVHNIGAFGRLRPGVRVGEARAEMNTVQQRIDDLNPTTERGLSVYVEPLKQELTGDVRGTLLLLFGAVGMVLLIACANAANLLLARSAARTREFAVRLALGAGRAQIVRQLLTESLLLAVGGGTMGLALAYGSIRPILAAAPGLVPRSENVGVNVPVLLFALLVSIAVGILFGLVPALKSSRPDLQSALRASAGSSAGHRFTQGVLVVVQIALTVVLLTGGSLLLRTIRNLSEVKPGFDARHVITMQVGLPRSVRSAAAVRAAYQRLVSRIRAVPGVEAAEITALVPLGGAFNEGPFWIGPHQPGSMAEIPRAVYYPVGPDYFGTMGIPLLRGRTLAPTDRLGSERVVVIDALLAKRFFGGRDAVGQSLTIPHWGVISNAAARIVGVVGHVEHYRLDGSQGQKPQIYYSFYQLPDELVPGFSREVSIAVRTRVDPETAMPAIRAAVYDTGSDQPIYNVRTLQQLVASSMGRQRFPMVLLSAFAGLALLLACVGTYGVVSYTTTRRIREIGIRMALGAEKTNVLRLVVGQGLRLALLGVATGAAAGLVLGRLLPAFSSLLYRVGTADPVTFAVSGLIPIGAAVLACYIPARRAARVDPIAALRYE